MAKRTGRGTGAATPRSNIGKLYNRKYIDTPVKHILNVLGLTITGRQRFTSSVKPNPNRTYCVPLVEGAVALLRQFVCECVTPAIGGTNGLVWCRIRSEAYEDVCCTDPQSDDAIVGINDAQRRISTTIASISQNAGSDDGHTDLAVYPLALLLAAERYRTNDDTGVELLRSHLSLIQRLDDIGELDLSGTSQTAGDLVAGAMPALAAELQELFATAADECYEFMHWGTSTNGLATVPQTSRLWTTRKINITSPPGWRANADDMAGLLTNPDTLAEFLGDRLFPRPAIQPPVIDPAGVPNTVRDPFEWASYIPDAALIVPPAGGSYGVLLQGRAGTRKTTLIFGLSDKMPTVRVGVTSEAMVELLLADHVRGSNGWAPALGELAKPIRASMLAAFVVALKRGATISDTLSRYKAEPITKALQKLAARPDDKDALNELDKLAMPFEQSTWAPFQSAYFESNAPAIGPVLRLFLDEIHDAADNDSLRTILKVLMEDQRKLLLSIAGAGWYDLYAQNVHLVAAGNPDECARTGSDFGRALRSRFGFAFGVGFPEEEEEKRLIFDGCQDAGAMFNYPPADLSLASYDYTPPVRSGKKLTAGMANAIAAFARWTREQHSQGMIAELLDFRGSMQIGRTMMHYLTRTNDPGQAFMDSIEPVVARLAAYDENGLPIQAQAESIRQQAAYLTTQHSLAV